jgi:very-short-patch-repair endonuclease
MKRKNRMTRRDDKKLFANAWFMCAGDAPQPISEYRFVAEALGSGRGLRTRIERASVEHGFVFGDWRFDFAWPDRMVAVEVDGGQYISKRPGGRHNTDQDRHKLNVAAMLGWRVLRFSNQMLEKEKNARAAVRIVLMAMEAK